MTFTDNILKVYRKQSLDLKANDPDSLDYFLHNEKYELKGLFKEVTSQKDLYKKIEIFSLDSFYRSTVEGELLSRVRQIFKTIGKTEYQQYIIKDISYLLKKEKSNFISTNDFIDKLYTLIILEKRFYRKKFYKYYKIVVRKLISWKIEIRKILSLKVTNSFLINLLSNKIRSLTKIAIQIPQKFDLQEYLDLVLSLKDYCLVISIDNLLTTNNLFSYNNHENRIHQIIMPLNRS
ncbi:MAG: hypothetical protein NTZ85_01330 [Bacteroidia bacterium]|nr:hypothetical protein [Bacteroidia bacterium]